MRILSDIETALSSEFFKDVRRRFRRRNRKSLFAEQLFSPKSARKLSEQESPTPQSRLARRHSSTDNYLETRELEYPMRRPPPSPAAVDASKRFSMNEDTTDLTYVEIAGFTSDPDFLGSYEREQRKEESFLTHSGEEQKNDEPDAGQIRVPPRVTFSDSTADVTAKETPCYKHNNSSSSVSSTTAMSMLDFELDVVVDIDSGKCVLHTENEKEKEEERSGLYAK